MLFAAVTLDSRGLWRNVFRGRAQVLHVLPRLFVALGKVLEQVFKHEFRVREYRETLIV